LFISISVFIAIVVKTACKRGVDQVIEVYRSTLFPPFTDLFSIQTVLQHGQLFALESLAGDKVVVGVCPQSS